MGEITSDLAEPGAEPKMGERQVGQYVLEEKLGEGGMAEVWKARHQVLGTRVAIKFLAAGLAGIPDVEQRFLGEGKRQAQLQHANIVSAFDFLYEDGRSYLIMKYIEGQSLDEWLFKLQAPMPFPQALAVSTDVLRALDYAHSKNVVHRDIKPSNILVENGGRAFVMDFGIALMLGEQRATRVGVAIGTPHYMSPEQIVGSRNIDRRSDIYSFGCVLYQMLTEKVPFEVAEGEGDTAYLIKDKHLRQPPVPPRQVNPDIPVHVERAILRCLEKNASDRFDTCQELLQALIGPAAFPQPPIYPGSTGESPAPVAGDVLPLRPRTPLTPRPTPQPPAQPVKPAVPITDTSAVPAPVPSPVPPSRNPAVFWIAGVCLLALFSVGGFYFYKQKAVTPAPIVNPVSPSPVPDVTLPKPSPVPPVVAPKPDDTQQPVIKLPAPPPENPPVKTEPEKPVQPVTPVPVPPQQPPVNVPDSKTTQPPVQPGPAPPVNPGGPAPGGSTPPRLPIASEGNLVWSGAVEKNQIIEISDRSANAGNLAGDPLPGDGVPVQVSINNNKFAVISQPNPLNGFSRMSLRSTMKGNVTVTIHWRVLSSE